MLDSKKKILFIIHNLEAGGAERVLTILLNNLDYSMYQIDLLVLAHTGFYCDKINKNVNVIPLYPTIELWEQAVLSGSFNALLHQKIKPIYDVQISFLEGFSIVVAKYFGNPLAKKIGWIHCYPKNSYEFLKVFKDDYASMDQLVFVSQSCLNSYVELFGESFRKKSVVISNPINLEHILSQSKQNISFKKEKQVVLSIGRLVPVKGYDKLIQAHAQLIKDGYDHDLLILGTGPEQDTLTTLIEQLDVKSSVKLLGFTSNPYPYLSLCDIFVSSSVSEAYPLAIAEAMTLQKPIVATLTAGSTELLKYKYGLLVENSMDGLYLGLKHLLSSPQQKQYYQHLLSNAQLFDLHSTVKQIEQLFDN